MLVIKAEIWPQGNVASRFEIARIGIINRGDGSPALADYDVISILGRDRKEWITQGVVLAHMRHHGWRPLTVRALTPEDSPRLLHREYVEDITDLLKRG